MSVGKTFGPSGQKRKPKMTVAELAEELGVKHQKLSALLSKPGAPKHCLSNRSVVGMRTWFDPDEVRVWFAGLKND